MNARSTLLLVAVLIPVLAALGYLLMGPVPAGIFSIFLIGGLIAWRMTTYGQPADPEPIVVPYLLAVVLFIVTVPARAEHARPGIQQMNLCTSRVSGRERMVAANTQDLA